MPTTIDLGRKVKAKYPGVYDDLGDQELGERVRAKYPGYSDFTDPGFGERALVFGEDVGRGALSGAASTVFHGGDVIRRALGMQRVIENPDVRATMTPPPTLGGKLGFGGEQAAEYLLPIGPEIKGAGLARGALRVGEEALRSGLISGAQTGTWGGAATGAGLGAGGATLGEAGRVVAPKLYEKALPFAQKLGFKTREEMVARGLKAGEEIPITRGGISKLEEEVGRNKTEINRLTKEHPVYSQRSIEIDDLLKPVDDYIERLGRTDPEIAKNLAKKRALWARKLGYEPGTPAQRVPTGLLDANGNPIMRTVAGTSAQTATTAAQAQEFKELLRENIPESAYGAGSDHHSGQKEIALAGGCRALYRGRRRWLGA